VKTKFPDILKYKEWIQLFSEIDFHQLRLLNKVDNLETREMTERRYEIIKKMESMEDDFKELEKLMIDYKRLFVMNELDFKINPQKDLKSTNNNTYMTAKIMWPDDTGEDRAIRISLGRIDENEVFSKELENKYLEMGQNALKKTLKEMYGKE
jgi:histidinol-phosphate/aromatic aminotransferase/cobyric acid decarboxylase-like protein